MMSKQIRENQFVVETGDWTTGSEITVKHIKIMFCLFRVCLAPKSSVKKIPSNRNTKTQTHEMITTAPFTNKINK